MAKHDRRKTSGQPPSSRPVTIQVPLPVLGVVNGVREAFHGFCIATGLQVLEAMMEADREVLCGAKGRHQVERPAWRGGSVDSQVTLGGRQVELPRLRVRSSDGEVPLASFQWAAATDPLDEHTLAAVAAGVSTRRYAGTLDPVPADVTERATSSSAVSRRFVALSTKRLQAFQPAVGRVGPAGGLHRRQGLPGPLHGDRVGDRHAGPETRAGPARRRHRDGCRHHRPAQRPGDARTESTAPARLSSASTAPAGRHPGRPTGKFRAAMTLVCDHLNTHTKGAFYEVFEPARARELVRRIEFCHTPKHGSWLNIAENELSSMTRQCVRGRRIGDLGTLHDEVSAWSTDVNGTQRGVDWQMKVDDARCKLKSVYPKIMKRLTTSFAVGAARCGRESPGSAELVRGRGRRHESTTSWRVESQGLADRYRT